MKKTWILIGTIMLLYTLYQVAISYAKYSNTASATVEKQAGAWIVKVNNQNIVNSSGTATTFNINNLTYPSSSQYVAQNKMAPGTNGYFDIIIDPTGCSVAIRYDVKLDVESLDIIDSIKFSSAYRVVNNTEVSEGIIETDENTYSGIISLADVKNSVPTTVRFYLEWEEKGSAAADAADSELGLVRGNITSLPVKVEVSQYLGETLVQN